MAFSKANLFPSQPYHQSFWAKAQAHPARIMILTYLLENGTSPFYEIRKIIPLASTTVSQHIRYLRIGGLIEASEKFPYTYYSINKTTCQNLAIELTNLQMDFM